MIPFFTDVAKTILAVVKATDKITDWSILPLELGISIPDLQRIEKDNHTAKLQHRAIVLKWLGMGEASWASLAQALRDSGVDGGKAVANQIAKDHPKVNYIVLIALHFNFS